MDSSRFDRLTRALAGAASRRGVLTGLLAGALLPVAPDIDARAEERRRNEPPLAKDRERGSGEPGGDGPETERCGANGQRCGKGSGKRGKPCRTCCSRFSVRAGRGRRCSCKPEGTAAGNLAQCCSGRRSTGGYCGACDPGLTACPSGCIDLDDDDANCGRCGNACGDGRRCAEGRCICDAESCPQGCCDQSAQCQPGTADGACGTGGSACIACGGTTPVCEGGTCACAPDCAGKCGGAPDGCGGTCTGPCGPTELCADEICVTGIGTCTAGANICLGPIGNCNDNPECFCIPTGAGATRCARYYTTGQGFLRPCSGDAECDDLGPGAFCPQLFDSCGGVCSLPC